EPAKAPAKAKVLKPASSDLLFQSRGRSGWQWQGTAVAGPPKLFLRFFVSAYWLFILWLISP
ncbi:MAG: hypothetical protein K7J46_14880, partial [Bryobacter sp.]|nr:hypothetical protein [Bryobacter sp. CoA8 C33]